jgi:plasmid stability protein
MGEMTIRNIDDALLVELREIAERQGTDVESFAADLIRRGLRARIGGRAAVAREIQAAQPTLLPVNSVDLIREDRAHR